MATSQLNRDILIGDNDIAGGDNGCISVSSASHVSIVGNRCADFNRDVGSARLFLDGGGLVETARRLNSKAMLLLDARRQGIWVDPVSMADVQVHIMR